MKEKKNVDEEDSRERTMRIKKEEENEIGLDWIWGGMIYLIL